MISMSNMITYIVNNHLRPFFFVTKAAFCDLIQNYICAVFALPKRKVNVNVAFNVSMSNQTKVAECNTVIDRVRYTYK